MHKILHYKIIRAQEEISGDNTNVIRIRMSGATFVLQLRLNGGEALVSRVRKSDLRPLLNVTILKK